MSARTTLRLLVALGLLLSVLGSGAVWVASPRVVMSMVAVYHATTGFCLHPLRITWADGDDVLALVVVLSATSAATRGFLYALRQRRQTSRWVQEMLALTVQQPPSMTVSAAQRLGLVASLDVIALPAPLAFCYGFIRPRIGISTGMIDLLEPVELDAVLLHENHHRRRRDPLRLLVSGTLARAFGVVPILHDLARRYDVLKEFDADAAAVRQLGDLRPMAGALYKVLSSTTVSRQAHPNGVSGLSATEQRIDHLLTPGASDGPCLPGSHLIVSYTAILAASLPVALLMASRAQFVLDACRF